MKGLYVPTKSLLDAMSLQVKNQKFSLEVMGNVTVEETGQLHPPVLSEGDGGPGVWGEPARVSPLLLYSLWKQCKLTLKIICSVLVSDQHWTRCSIIISLISVCVFTL